MSNMWREDPSSDSNDYVAQGNVGGWSRVSSHPVVRVEPVGSLTIHKRYQFITDEEYSLPPGKYLIVRAADE